MGALHHARLRVLDGVIEVSVFLDAAQLRELTGYVKPSKQIAWLTRNGVAHYVNALGRPVVPSAPMDKKPVQEFALGPVR
jgi:hypothetical protein